jgi:hypothetical protein
MVHFFNDFKRDLNGKGETELVDMGLDLESAIRQCQQKKMTGQGEDQIKVCGRDLNIWITAKQKTGLGWLNQGTYIKLKKMRAMVLTKLSEKQRLK